MISLGAFIINFMFLNPITEILTHFFRYLNANQLNSVVHNLLKFVFTKTAKVNLTR